MGSAASARNTERRESLQPIGPVEFSGVRQLVRQQHPEVRHQVGWGELFLSAPRHLLDLRVVQKTIQRCSSLKKPSEGGSSDA